MLNRFARRFNASIALILVLALTVTLCPSWAYAETVEEPQTGQPAVELPQAAGNESPLEQVTVVLAVGAPVLDPLPAYTNKPDVRINGKVDPAATITLYVMDSRNNKTQAGQATADEQGAFGIDFHLSVDGTYKFTAIASKDGQRSAESLPVPMTLDRVPPAAPQKSAWFSAVYDEVLLQWESAEPVGSLKFHILRNGVEVGTTEETEFRDTGLTEQSAVSYTLISEDLAGNRSPGITVQAGTLPDRLTVLGTSETGEMGNGGFSPPVISGDGNTSAFYSDSTNLIQGVGEPGKQLLYIRDLLHNRLEYVVPEGEFSEFDTVALNQDGRFVVFSLQDIYLMDRAAGGGLTRVTSGNGDSYSASVSADGSVIVFASEASDLTAGDTNEVADVFVYQRETGVTTRIAPTKAYYTIKQVIVSGNGKFIAWRQELPIDAGTGELVLYNRETGESATVHESAGKPSISADGRFIAYVTDNMEVSVYDRIAGTSKVLKTRSSVAVPQISADGKWVVFENGSQVLWMNVASGESKAVGNPAANAYSPQISGNGSRIVYMGDNTAARTPVGWFKYMAYAVCPVSCSAGNPTDPQPIERVSWTATSMMKGQVKIGTELTISAAGAAGGTSSATVAYRHIPQTGEASETREKAVPLTESAVQPGTYTGRMQLEEGMAEILTITGQITDSQGQTSSGAADRLPLKVTGAVQAEVELSPSDLDPSALTGARLIAWSAEKKTGSTITFVAGRPLIVPLADTSDYNISLLAADGTVLAEMPAVSVKNGIVEKVKLTVRLPAHIRLNISAPGGAKGLEGVNVSVLDAAGEVIGSGVTDASGSTAIDSGLIGEEVTIAYRLPSPYASIPSETIKLEAVTLIAKEATIRYGTVTGTVRDGDGAVISGATVTVTRPNSVVSAVTDENGKFRLSAPEGESMISVVTGEGAPYTLKQPEPVDVISGEEATVELTVLTSRQQLKVELFVRYIGEEWQQQEIKINTTGRIYTLEIRDESGVLIGGNNLYRPTVEFMSRNGVRLNACMIDRLQRFAKICEPFVVNESQSPTVTFRLAERAAVKASLPEQLRDPRIYLYELKDGSKRNINGIYLNERAFRLSLPYDSTYLLDVRAYDSTTGNPAGVTRQFTAMDGQILDLGELLLQENGIFQNKPGNMLDVIGTEATAGGNIRLRGTYRYDGSNILKEASLLLHIPAGMALVDRSVLLNGLPADRIDLSDPAVAEVKLPAPLAKGASGTIYYELRTQGETGDYVQPELGIRFLREGSQQWMYETIGSVSVSMVVVSLEVPKIVSRKTLKVTGRAPSGSKVIIEDGRKSVGQAETTPYGTWSAEITLVGDAQEGIHELAAHAVRGEESWRSPSSYVTFDAHYPNPIELTIAQPGLIPYKVNVSDRVARFPYNVRPFEPLVFGLKFSYPERIQRVVLLVGGEEIPLTLNPLTQRYEAVKSSNQQQLGGISVQYDVTPLPYDPSSTTIEDIKQMLPPALRDMNFQVTQVELGATKGSSAAAGRVGVANVEISAKDNADDKLVMDYSFEPLPDYTPPPLPNGAPKVYELSYDFSPATGTGYFSAIVPAQEAQAAFKSMGIVSPLEFEVHAVVRITTNFKFSIKTPGAPGILGVIGAGWEAYKLQRDMNELNRLLDRVNDSDCLPPHFSQYYHNILNQMFERRYKNLGIIVAMQLGAMALASTGIGLIGGAAVVASTAVIKYKMDQDWQESLNALKAEFAADNAQCEENPDRPDTPDSDSPKRDLPGRRDGQEIARPDWTYDPSGYVYEAVASNRIEGVKATLLQQSPDGTSWSVWDADYYLQQNPLYTDGEGRYAWDVPEGKWQVRYDKAGYETAKSEVLTVLPPHFDVNVGLVSREAPHVRGLWQSAAKDALFVKFSKYMLPVLLSTDLVKVYLVADGSETEVPVTVKAVDAEQDPNGRTLATTYKLVPQTPFAAGYTYRVSIDSMVQSYAGVPMLQSFEQTLTIAETLPAMPEAVSSAMIIPGYGSLGIRWEEADIAEADHLLLKWKAQSGGTEEQCTVGLRDGAAALAGLPVGTYEIRLVTVGLDGRESAGVTLQGSPLVKTAPPVEKTPPGEVSGASVTAGTNTLTVKWTDPADLDLYYVEVRMKKPGAAEFEAPVKVAKGAAAYSFGGLTKPGIYEFKLTTADIRGNSSAGITVQGTIPVPEEPNPDPDAAVIVTVPGQTVYEVFDKSLRIGLAAGSVPDGTKIAIRRSQTPPAPPVSFLKQRSPVYAITSGARPAKPAQLTLAFDKSGLKALDYLKLGIYRYDPAFPGKWRFVGGIVDPEKGQIRTRISDWGTYAVLMFDLQFKDIKDPSILQQVQELASRQILTVTADGKFEPERKITHEEMIQMFVGIYGTIQGAESEESADALSAAVKIGLIADSRKFHPNSPVTREETAVLIARLLELVSIKLPETGVLPKFKDEKDIADAAKAAVASAVRSGIMQGSKPDQFKPKTPVSRAEAAVILLQLVKQLGQLTDDEYEK